MNPTPDITIIVPIYGVEQYIAKCIVSIQQQSFTNFEAILVNDGSQDRSVEIAQQTIAADPRFIILHQANAGLSAARNRGLDQARGRYIAFVDSDDWVEPEFLEKTYQHITQHQADICLLGVNYVDEQGTVLRIKNNDLDAYHSKHDFFLSQDSITQFAWSKLYKKSLFNEFRFNESQLTYEDVYLTFRLIYQKKMVDVRQPLYNYLQRQGTLSRGIKPSYLKDRLAIVDIQDTFAKQRGLDTRYADYIDYTYLKTFVFYSIVDISRYSSSYWHDITQLKQAIHAEKFTLGNICRLTRRDKKVGLSLLLFKLSPGAFRAFVRYWFRNHVA